MFQRRRSSNHGADGVSGSRLITLIAGVAIATGLLSPGQSHAQPNTAATAWPAPTEVSPDPWQPFNRQMYSINGLLDDRVFAPITHAYVAATPTPLRRALGAAVDNLREPRTVLNDLLQARPNLAGQAAGRFILNSSVGALGFIDMASSLGLPVHRSDFGQTLGRYGLPPGRYVFVPLLGPLDLRDGAGRLVDALTDPISLVAGGASTAFGASRLAVSAIDYRATMDGQIEALEDEATDPYVTVRSAYMQHRASLVGQARGVEPDLPALDVPGDEP